MLAIASAHRTLLSCRSNSPSRQQSSLAALGIVLKGVGRRFAWIVGRRKLGLSRPARAGIHAALSDLMGGALVYNGHVPVEPGSWAHFGHKRKRRRIPLIQQPLIWCGEGDLNPHEIAPASTSS